MNNNTKIVYCCGTISHVDKPMPWGTSRDHFVLGTKLDREQLVNTWWAKVNNYEFLKELNYINSTSDKQYIYTRDFEIGKHFEIMLILDHFSKWINENPCPVRLLYVGKGEYYYRTELLALRESIITGESGYKASYYSYKTDEIRLHDLTRLKDFCNIWDIEIENLEVYLTHI